MIQGDNDAVEKTYLKAVECRDPWMKMIRRGDSRDEHMLPIPATTVQYCTILR